MGEVLPFFKIFASKELTVNSVSEEIKEEAAAIAKNKKKVAACVSVLSGSSRRDRQRAAATIAVVATIKPESLLDHVDELVDALNRPESQTRWEVLDALTELIGQDARVCEKALLGAETALFDEDSGPLRLAAMQFLCRYGATTENRSEKVWSLIDEGIQCYHGDIEFPDMLIAVIDFSNGKLSKQVKKELKDRMKFDAENGKGILGRRAAQIVKNVK